MMARDITQTQQARGSPGAGRKSSPQPPRRQQWAGKSSQEIMALHPADKYAPEQVLKVLLDLFNGQHTSLAKSVSHKTRRERADFLRRFFRDLRTKAGFATVPDPRNLSHRHIQTMVQVWQRQKLAPATIQTYLSFLRGLASWIDKPGLVRKPADYGLRRSEYERKGNAQHDKSWTAHGIDIDAVLAQVSEFDPYVGACLQLIRAFGLRRKEAVMFRPHTVVVPFEETGLEPMKKQAEWYVRVKQGAKGGRLRYVPVNDGQRQQAVSVAQTLVTHRVGHMGNPNFDLKQNLRRFSYVMERFGVTARMLGSTAHGLRHEKMIDEYFDKAGAYPPVRGNRASVDRTADDMARKAVAELAGHHRIRVSGAYVGAKIKVSGADSA